ncbi:hypothetical protein BG003_004731 [Podila horticola]|nr:hypothetical protein BG003_004731 [Podila horticola]
MFTLIAPIAFGEPFVPFNITTDASHIGQRTPGRKLCRTLLNSRPVKQLPKLLQLVYFPEYSAQGCGEYDPTSPLLLDYSSYIRHLHFNVSIPLHPDFNAHLPSKQVLPLEELVVPEITKNVDRYLVEDHQIVLGPLHRLNTYSRLLDVHLRVTLTWTLCEPILEQIQSIDIPLSDIDRYLSVVHRFRSLSSVNFIDDFALDCPERQFPVASDGLWACPGHSETQGFGDRYNWSQLYSHVDSTCLDRVTRIATPVGHIWHTDLAKAGPVWSLCRSLEELELMFYPTPYNHEPVLAIDDLAVAFSDTLEDITYNCLSINMDYQDVHFLNHVPASVTLIAGHQWVMMPALKNIAITLKNIAIATSIHDLVLNAAWLQLCPALTCIDIHSQRQDFDPATRTWSEPSQVPDLRMIKMVGATAQSFNMDTFSSTRLVNSIEPAVSNAEQYRFFDEDAPGFDYDLNLPFLTSLCLGAGFANLFEFRMRSRAGVETWDGVGYISCLQLIGMNLRGQFTLTPEVLHTLSTYVMSNLTRVQVWRSRGHGVEDWIREVQRLKDLAMAETDLPELSEVEMEALGLKLYGDGHTIQHKDVEKKAVYQFERMYVMRD